MAEENEGSKPKTQTADDSGREAVSIDPRQTPIGRPINSHRKKSGYFNKPKNWVSLGTLVFVIIYTVITALMWRTNDRQLAAVIEGNKTNREAFTAVQRAFVVVSELTQAPFDYGGGHDGWTFFPAIKNTGYTPTANLVFLDVTPYNLDLMKLHAKFSDDQRRAACFAEASNVSIDPDVLYETVTMITDVPSIKQMAIRSFILGPQDKATYGLIEQTAHSMDRAYFKRSVQFNSSRKYYFGEIRYNDVLPRTSGHVTKYCYAVNAITGDDKGDVPIMGLCRHWNCADDECKRDKEAFDAEMRQAANEGKSDCFKK
jgi:hypothetical protein